MFRWNSRVQLINRKTTGKLNKYLIFEKKLWWNIYADTKKSSKWDREHIKSKRLINQLIIFKNRWFESTNLWVWVKWTGFTSTEQTISWSNRQAKTESIKWNQQQLSYFEQNIIKLVTTERRGIIIVYKNLAKRLLL